MFGYAVKHHAKKADLEVENNQNLTPLTLASKLGRNNIFKEIIELQSVVGHVFIPNFSDEVCIHIEKDWKKQHF